MPSDKGPKQAPETAPIGRKIGCPPLISERAIQRGAYRLSDSKAKGKGNRGNKAPRITGERDKGETIGQAIGNRPQGIGKPESITGPNDRRTSETICTK